MNEVVKLAVDSYRGCVSGNFSKDDTKETLRQALIEANNGETVLNYKSVRDGKCFGLFSIVEEILNKTVVEGLQEDDFFVQMVDFRNIALGDQNEFYSPDTSLFVVSESADGTMGTRRQRLNAGEKKSITPTPKIIRVYEELSRLLSGRVDINEFIERVGNSFKAANYEEIYNVWSSLTASALGATYYPTAGTYNERALIKLVQHVEAASGKQASIVGTKLGLSLLGTSVQSNSAKEDLYKLGYVGRFNGTPVISMRNGHKVGKDEFIIDDNKILVIASDNKPVKFVTEGESTIMLSDPTANADLTQEYVCIQKTGCAAVISEKFAVYETTDTL